MQLNDAVSITTLQSEIVDDYIDYESDAGVFMSTHLFPLTCAFSDTSKIVYFEACLCASIYLNYYYYTSYYKKLGEYVLNVY